MQVLTRRSFIGGLICFPNLIPSNISQLRGTQEQLESLSRAFTTAFKREHTFRLYQTSGQPDLRIPRFSYIVCLDPFVSFTLEHSDAGYVVLRSGVAFEGEYALDRGFRYPGMAVHNPGFSNGKFLLVKVIDAEQLSKQPFVVKTFDELPSYFEAQLKFKDAYKLELIFRPAKNSPLTASPFQNSTTLLEFERTLDEDKFTYPTYRVLRLCEHSSGPGFELDLAVLDAFPEKLIRAFGSIDLSVLGLTRPQAPWVPRLKEFLATSPIGTLRIQTMLDRSVTLQSYTFESGKDRAERRHYISLTRENGDFKIADYLESYMNLPLCR